MDQKEQYSQFRSKAGHPIHVRTLRFDDAPLLVNIFDNMTIESRYRRYHQVLDKVSPTRVHQEALNIAQADPNRNWGLIAFTDLLGQPNTPIGAVRLVRTDEDVAEVAISICDDFQNLGIGKQLMHLLAKAAHDMGLKRLVADIQNDNTAIWHVFNSLPYQVLRLPDGFYSNIVITLTSPLEKPTSGS